MVFKPGDICRVKGDVADWEHSLPVGHEVKIVDALEPWHASNYPIFRIYEDPQDPDTYEYSHHGYKVILMCNEPFCEEQNHLYISNGEHRDVAVIDLELTVVPVTDEEMEVVYKSLGVDNSNPEQTR